MRKLLAVLMIFATSAMADPPKSITVDLAYSIAAPLTAYQANQKTFRLTCRNNNSQQNGMGYDPYVAIFPSNRASGIVTAACTWITQTSCVFDASFSPAMLNTNGSWMYEVGIKSNGNTTITQGSFVIIPDPYASGAAAFTLSTNINMALFTFLNVDTYGMLLAGSNVTFRAGTGGRFYIDSNASTVTTNGLASLAYVDASTNSLWSAVTNWITGLFVKQSDTNGWVVSSHDGFVTVTVTNGILESANIFTTNAVTNISVTASSAYTNSLTNSILIGAIELELSNRSNLWNQASIDGSNWVLSVAHGITDANTNDWLKWVGESNLYVRAFGGSYGATSNWTFTANANNYISIQQDRLLLVGNMNTITINGSGAAISGPGSYSWIGNGSSLTNIPLSGITGTGSAATNKSTDFILNTSTGSLGVAYALKWGGLTADGGVGSAGQVIKADGLGGMYFYTLGTAAANATGDFANAAQGTLADTALQPDGSGASLTGFPFCISLGYSVTINTTNEICWSTAATGSGTITNIAYETAGGVPVFDLLLRTNTAPNAWDSIAYTGMSPILATSPSNIVVQIHYGVGAIIGLHCTNGVGTNSNIRLRGVE